MNADARQNTTTLDFTFSPPLSLKGTPTRKWAAEGEESAPESAREYLQTRQEATCSHDRFIVTLI